jgi:hypothetical protein
MTLSQVASRTSNAVGTDDGENQGALFDETAGSYKSLREKVEKHIVELITNNVRRSLSAYERINPWSSLSPVPSIAVGQTLTPTAELDALLSTLTTYFGFLAKTLSPVSLRRVARTAVHTIDQQIFDQVILRHSFSAFGALQLGADLAAVRAVIQKHVGDGVAESGFVRLDEAIGILGIPVRGSRNSQEEETHEKDVGEEKKWGLWEVEKRLFQSGGEDAKAFLVDELNIERLSVADARKVLARKVELGS